MKIFRNWTFKWWELGLLKICLLSLGIMLGLYFYNSIIGLVWVWWVLVAVPVVYFISKLMAEGGSEEPAPIVKEQVVINKIPPVKEQSTPASKDQSSVTKSSTPPQEQAKWQQQPSKEPTPQNKPPMQATQSIPPKEQVQPKIEPVQANKPVSAILGANMPPAQTQAQTQTTPPAQGTMPLK